MPKKTMRKSLMIPIRLEPELVKGLDLIGLKSNLYRSELIREAIKDLIKKYDALEQSSKVSH